MMHAHIMVLAVTIIAFIGGRRAAMAFMHSDIGAGIEAALLVSCVWAIYYIGGM